MYLLPGEFHASAEPCQIRTILGSCVSICVWDVSHLAGGMNHFLLPSSREAEPGSLRFADLATKALLEELLRVGCRLPNLRAKIFGGGSMFQKKNRLAISLGEQNVAAGAGFDEERKDSRERARNRGNPRPKSRVQHRRWHRMVPANRVRSGSSLSIPQMDVDLELLLKSFVSETAEGLAQMEEALLELQLHPDDVELVNTVFRVVHTFKGNAGIFELKHAQEFAHTLEDLLDRIRHRDSSVSPDTADVLLASMDVLRGFTTSAADGKDAATAKSKKLLQRMKEELEAAPTAKRTKLNESPNRGRKPGKKVNRL